MPGIDHIVHAVRDLDRAAGLFAGLGFTLTPQAQHPFGTGNRLAQLQGCFIELLAVTRPADVPPAAPGRFSFGAYNQDFLKSEEGMSMLALTSEGWEADRARFDAAGLPLYEPFAFGRKARQPDGTETELDFRLTFTTDRAMPAAPFFTCNHHHAAEVFWKPAFQAHENGASGVAEVLMTADDPTPHAAFLERLFGAAEEVPGGLRAQMSGACLCLLTPEALQVRFPGAVIAPPPAGQARFAGYRVTVADLDEVAARAGALARPGEGLLWLAPGDACGALLAFSEG